jgi:hypothetical protein
MSEQIEKIKRYVENNAPKVMADYNIAPFGEWLGFYIDDGVVSHAVGQDIGNEIAENERPIIVLKCPGIGNIESDFWLSGWTHQNEDKEIVVDETNEIIDFAEAIIRCCEEGDISSMVEGMQEEIDNYEASQI